MRVGIVGAGVVGLTTAHALCDRSAQVTVIDSGATVGTGASYANAGQLAYGNAAPLGTPKLFKQVLKIACGQANGISVGLAPNVHYYRWLFAFLRQCLPSAYASNAAQLDALAERASQRMQAYHDDFGCEYLHQKNGKIVLLEHSDDAPDALTRAQLEQVEPSLATWDVHAPFGTFAPHDEVGDARRFAQALARRLQSQGAEFLFETEVLSLKPVKDGWQLDTAAGTHQFDQVVLCSGNGTNDLLASLGVQMPLFPVAGFSYTFSAGPDANTASITVAEHKIVYSRLGDKVRVAGYANINNSQKQVRRHAQNMLQVAQRMAPNAAVYDDQQPWIGYRPSTPSSLPIVGPSKHAGLYYNFGHGMLGWTLCAASAEQVASDITRMV